MRPLVLVLLTTAPLAAQVSTAQAPEGFQPMFNGKDLSGWVNVNCHPDTFYVKDNMIVTTGKPTGFLRTEKQYENFIAEFDWMHTNTDKVGNSGFFVWADPIPAVGTGYTRGIEVQVLVNLTYKDKSGNITASSHGDLFSIWGATCVPDRPHPAGSSRCMPSEDRCKGGGEWNHYKVIANDGVLKLEVNGKEVSGVSKCNPRKGYLALESEGAECKFKNLYIKELPSTDPKAEEVADVYGGHVNLFNGLDFTGWKATGDWKALDGIVAFSGNSGKLSTEKAYGDFELVVDWRQGAKGKTQTPDAAAILVQQTSIPVPSPKVETTGGAWNRYVIRSKGGKITATLNGRDAFEGPTSGAGPITLQANNDQVQFRNLFLRELK